MDGLQQGLGHQFGGVMSDLPAAVQQAVRQADIERSYKISALADEIAQRQAKIEDFLQRHLAQHRDADIARSV